MQTLIVYSADSRAYLRWLERGKPADTPDDVPFSVPDDAKKGDRYLLYVGGSDQVYVGHGRIRSNWKVGQGGGWKGEWFVDSIDVFQRVPVPGADVTKVTGFSAPKREKVIGDDIATLVWKAARGKPLTDIDRAIEGIVSESRSKSRNAALRTAAIARADGVCQCCRTDFKSVASGMGLRCLVVHHKKQLKDSDQPVETRLTDLAVVCANCHMLVHSNPAKALTLAQVRSRLGVAKRT